MNRSSEPTRSEHNHKMAKSINQKGTVPFEYVTPNMELALENEWDFYYDHYLGPGLTVQVSLFGSQMRRSTRMLSKELALLLLWRYFEIFLTWQTFWRYFNHLPTIKALGPRNSYHLMKAGVLPLWEDPRNVNGGHLAIKISLKESEKAWLYSILAVIGEQFDDILAAKDDICGVSISKRKNEAVISIWNSRADLVNIAKWKGSLKSLLKGVRLLDISYKGLISPTLNM